MDCFQGYKRLLIYPKDVASHLEWKPVSLSTSIMYLYQHLTDLCSTNWGSKYFRTQSCVPSTERSLIFKNFVTYQMN